METVYCLLYPYDIDGYEAMTSVCLSSYTASQYLAYCIENFAAK